MRHKPALARTLFLAVALTQLACASACPTVVAGNASGVLVLLDFSRTFAPYNRPEDSVTLSELSKAIVKESQEFLDKPVKILWTAFGDDGLNPFLPCGPAHVFNPVLIGVNPPATAAGPEAQLVDIRDEAGLTSWLAACQTSVLATSQSAQQFTDLSGAVAMAERQLAGTTGEKVVFVLSDFREDLPPNRQVPSFKIEGTKYVLIWRRGLADAAQPSALLDHVALWKDRLAKAGASAVCEVPSQGLTEGDITRCRTK